MKYVAPVSIAFTILAFALAGCGSNSAGPANANSPSATSDAQAGHHHGGHDQGAVADHAQAEHAHGDDAHDAHTGQLDMEKMMAELAKLSPEDRASAENQHVCPVSGEMLGTMGPPLKVTVNGSEVWVCCSECRNELQENPDAYVAKLKH